MKVFDIPRKDDDEREPLEFSIRVRRLEPKPDTEEIVEVPEVHEFKTLIAVPAGILNRPGDNVTFISGLLDQDSERRFRALTRDKDIMIEGKDLNDIVKWLLEEMVNRPTNRPSPSGSGSSAIGATSGESSPSEA